MCPTTGLSSRKAAKNAKPGSQPRAQLRRANDRILQPGKSFRLNKRVQFPLFVSLVAFCWASRQTGAQLDLTEANEGNEERALRGERKTGERLGEHVIRIRSSARSPAGWTVRRILSCTRGSRSTPRRRLVAGGAALGPLAWETAEAVSYTHLTLPTILRV